MDKSTTWVAAALALAITTPAAAQSTKWYVLDASTATCQVAATFYPAGGSPDLMQRGLRNQGTFGSLKIMRNDENEITGVVVTNTDHISLYYFPKLTYCTIMKDILIKSGLIAPTKELN